MKCPKCDTENPETQKFCGECGTQFGVMEDIPAGPTATLETPIEELTTGSMFAGRYQIIEELGSGGMGKVYRALDKKLDEEVALKLIKPEIASDKKTLERFSNELKVARKISHKNIGRMYELMEDKGTHFITMEYVPGEDLRSFIRRSGQMAVGTTLRIASQVCEGLAEAHKLGVVHRDLKPSNIMIDKQGNAKIMDFGIARSLDVKGITGAGIMIGTPEYMSPEQAEAKDTDRRSDIYSFGIILYEMLTGQLPFEGDTPLSIAMKHKGEIPKDPKELNAQIPDALSLTILKCLEKEKDARYPSAESILQDLTSITSGIPTTQREIPAKKPLTSREITVSFNIRRLLLPAVVLVAMIAIVLLIWKPWSSKAPTAASSATPSLAIMEFANSSGETGLDKMFVDMLTVKLSQYENLEVKSYQHLAYVLSRLENKNIDTIDVATASEIANRAGIDHMILGNISKIGDKIHVTSELIKVQDGAILTAEHEEGDEVDDIFGMANRLSEKFAIKLGVVGDNQISKIQDVTTNSYQAYQYYMQGLDNLWFWALSDAAEDFKKAIDIDPEFAMAYLYLTLAESGYGMVFMNPFWDKSPYKETLARAKELSGKVTEKERFWITILEALSVLDMEKLFASTQKLIDRYPQEKMGYFFQGFVHWIRQDYQKAAEGMEKVLLIDPAFAQAYNQLAYIYGFMQNRSEVKSAARKYIALHPDRRNAYHSGWEAHMMAGMYDDAIQLMEEAKENLPDYLENASRFIGRSLLLKGEVDRAREIFHELESPWHLSYCSLFEGKYKEALSFVDGILESAQEKENLRGQRSGRNYRALILALQKKYEMAMEEIAIAKKLTQKIWSKDYLPRSVFVDYVDGLILTKKGDHEAAEAKTESIRKKIQENKLDIILMDYYYLLLAELYILQNEGEKAAGIVEKFTGSACLTSAHYWHILARVHELQRDWDKAIEIYRRSYSNTTLTYAGISDPVYFFLSASLFDYRVGKLYEKKGDVAKAIEHLEKFVDRWKDADPGQPELEDAKKRLASLRSQ
jgi:serine/threonine protein kinase/Tfp pilus assembly protein PilF